MKVDLVSNDETVTYATVDVPDFPDNPQIVGWHGKYFTSNFGYGPDPVNYIEQTFLEIV